MKNLLDLIEKEPDNIEARMELAKIYIDKEDYKNAQHNLLKVIKLDPENINANYILSQLYEFNEEYEQAVGHLEKVLRTQDNYNLLYTLAQLYEKADNYEKSFEIYKNCIKKKPDDFDVYQNLSHVCIILGKTKEAIKCNEVLIAQNPKNIVALNQLAELYEKTDKLSFFLTKAKINEIEKNYPGAISFYKKALVQTEDKDKIIEIKMAISQIYTEENKLLNAVDGYLEVIEIDNKNFNAYKKLGETYYNLENLDSASEAYEKALELAKDDINILEKLSEIYIENKNYEKAEDLCKKIIKQSPQKIEPHISLAKVYIAQNMDKLAIEKLNYTLEKDPKNVEVLSMLADHELSYKNFKQALFYADKIKEIIPQSPFGYKKAAEIYEANNESFNSHFNYGLYHELKGEKQLAIDEFGWALEANPQNTEIILKIAKLYEDISEDFIAIDFYQQAFGADNQNTLPLKKMVKLYTKHTEYEQAIDCGKRIIDIDNNDRESTLVLAELYEIIKDYDIALETYKKCKTFSGTSTWHKTIDEKIEKLELIINGDNEEGLLDKIARFFSS